MAGLDLRRRSQPTYEELKLSGGVRSGRAHTSSQPTYEELKQGEEVYN